MGMAKTLSMGNTLTIGKGAIRLLADRGKLSNRSIRDIAVDAKLLVMRLTVMPRPNEPIANRNATMLTCLLKLNFV
jgi:uncharacterized protein (UPF0254 family)